MFDEDIKYFNSELEELTQENEPIMDLVDTLDAMVTSEITGGIGCLIDGNYYITNSNFEKLFVIELENEVLALSLAKEISGEDILSQIRELEGEN